MRLSLATLLLLLTLFSVAVATDAPKVLLRFEVDDDTIQVSIHDPYAGESSHILYEEYELEIYSSRDGVLVEGARDVEMQVGGPGIEVSLLFSDGHGTFTVSGSGDWLYGDVEGEIAFTRNGDSYTFTVTCILKDAAVQPGLLKEQLAELALYVPLPLLAPTLPWDLDGWLYLDSPSRASVELNSVEQKGGDAVLVFTVRIRNPVTPLPLFFEGYTRVEGDVLRERYEYRFLYTQEVLGRILELARNIVETEDKGLAEAWSVELPAVLTPVIMGAGELLYYDPTIWLGLLRLAGSGVLGEAEFRYAGSGRGVISIPLEAGDWRDRVEKVAAILAGLRGYPLNATLDSADLYPMYSSALLMVNGTTIWADNIYEEEAVLPETLVSLTPLSVLCKEPELVTCSWQDGAVTIKSAGEPGLLDLVASGMVRLEKQEYPETGHAEAGLCTEECLETTHTTKANQTPIATPLPGPAPNTTSEKRVPYEYVAIVVVVLTIAAFLLARKG